MRESKNLENNIVRIIAVLGFLLIAYFAIQVFFGVYTEKLTRKLSGPVEVMDANFKAQIASQTDPYACVKFGLTFSNTDKPELALLSFEKATSLDPNYRDGWVMRGYGELENNQPEKAIESLKKAETIDPINPRTYELLAIAYTQTNETDSAKKAQEKWEYLTKAK